MSSDNLDLILLQEVRMSQVQIENLLPGFKAEVNIDVNNSSKPGTALVWKEGLPVENVFSPYCCRVQIASLRNYIIINTYAPSGSSNRHEREVFFGNELLQLTQFGPNCPIICGGGGGF